jgi:Zn-dependent peptidase ImmA (M78 family)/transcriptional regulator with XRE-family HTH domain
MARKSIDALVTPAMVKWARDSIGMDLEQAAKKIGVSVEKLRAWESGDALPTIVQLREVGRVYQRPIAVFYLAAPPTDFEPMKYFRRFPGAAAATSSALNLAIRRALGRREVVAELTALLDGPAPQLSLRGSVSGDAADLARRARSQVLGVSIESQLGWTDPGEAFRAWRTAVEGAGVLVFQAPLRLSEMRAASIHESTYPIVLLNSKDLFPPARTFSLMHELGHLLVQEGAVCDLDLDDSDRLEVFCNAFAGELLVPEEALAAARVPKVKRSWTLDEIRGLARRLSVSGEVMFRRLVDTGRAPRGAYRAWRERREGLAPPAARTSGGNFYRNAIAQAGAPYFRLVLEAFHAERITASTLADYLGTKLDHVPKFEALVYGLAEGAKAK